MAASRQLALVDLEPSRQRFLADVLRGLARSPKRLPCKYFYDRRGSQLFDRICELDEYYLTRTELAIVRRHVAEMVDCLGEDCLLIEFGSGTSLKTRILLDHLRDPAGYVPVDISRGHLRAAAHALHEAYPHLRVMPVCADFTRRFRLPRAARPLERRVVYFPGSTIGNFTPRAAHHLLLRMADLAGPRGGLLIGVDLKKDRAVLELAYNDGQGVTAAFNLNLLSRINRELGADFDVEQFRHRAFYNAAKGRVEIYLESLREQTVTVGETEFPFAAGETICTEYSHKYSHEDFRQMAAAAGMTVARTWTDPEELFSVQYLEVTG